MSEGGRSLSMGLVLGFARHSVTQRRRLQVSGAKGGGRGATAPARLSHFSLKRAYLPGCRLSMRGGQATLDGSYRSWERNRW